MNFRNAKNLIRTAQAVTEDAREAHRLALEIADVPIDRHSALGGEGEDEACMRCGHINEAEYEIAVAMAEANMAAVRKAGELV